MVLGPGQLNKAIARKVVGDKKYRKNLSQYRRQKIEWGSSDLSVLKEELRLALRAHQDQRCVYCRRILVVERKNAQEHIEHFLDKSKNHYRKWAFSCVNLTLACQACNVQKTTRDMGDPAIRLSQRYAHDVGEFRWLHPYFDDYHANIEIRRGWVYVIKAGAPQYARASNLVDECRLADVSRIENHREKIKNRIIRLTRLTTRAIKKKHLLIAERLSIENERYQNEQWFNH